MNIVALRFASLFMGLMLLNLTLTGLSDAKVEQKDIVGLWLFEEGAGEVAADTSGNGNDGEFVGDVKWANSKFGKGLEFNGQDTWLACGNDDSLSFADGSGFSIHAWVNASASPGGKCIIWRGLGCSTWSQYLLGTSAHENGELTTQASFHIRVANGGGKLETLGDEVPENEWVHLVGVFDEANLHIYINGKLSNSEKAEGPPWASPEQVYIGADPGCGMRCQWEGIIDEVAVFNTVLSDADVASLGSGVEGALSVGAAGKLATTWGQLKVN